MRCGLLKDLHPISGLRVPVPLCVLLADSFPVSDHGISYRLNFIGRPFPSPTGLFKPPTFKFPNTPSADWRRASSIHTHALLGVMHMMTQPFVAESKSLPGPGACVVKIGGPLWMVTLKSGPLDFVHSVCFG